MNIWNLIDPDLASYLTTTLLHFLWQGAALVAIAATTNSLLSRRSAQARYVIYVSTLFVMAVSVPLTFVIVLSVGNSVPRQVAVRETSANLEQSSLSGTNSSARENFESESGSNSNSYPSLFRELDVPGLAPAGNFEASAEPIPNVEVREAEPLIDSQPLPLDRKAVIERFVAIAYFVGVFAFLIRLMLASRKSLLVRRVSSPLGDSELIARLQVQATRFGLSRLPPIRFSERVAVPVVVGFFKPLILLPISATSGLSVDQVVVVIAHELAHIRRFDPIINLMQRVIESLLFFHPAVWWLSRQISNEREHACDERVLSAGVARTTYANALLSMAEIACQSGRKNMGSFSTATLAADGATPSLLKRRLLRILQEPNQSELRSNRWAFTLTASIVIVTLTGSGWIFKVTESAGAQESQRTLTQDSTQSDGNAQDQLGEEGTDEKSADHTLTFLQSLRPDERIEDPKAKGQELAGDDIARDHLRILYFGEPWSQGKPLVDTKTGYRVEVVTGCTVTSEFVALVAAYNEAVQAHHASSPAATQGDKPGSSLDETSADSGLLDLSTKGNGLTLAISPDGRRFAVMNGNPTRTMLGNGRSIAKEWEPTVDIFDAVTMKRLHSLELDELPQDTERPRELGPTFIEATAVVFSPDSKTIAVGSSVGQLMLFDVETGEKVKSLDDSDGQEAVEKIPDFWQRIPRVMGSVKAIAFSTDGKRIAVCGASFADWSESLDQFQRMGIKRTDKGRLKIFDLEMDRLLFNPVAHSDVVADVQYSPDGRFLASAGRWMEGFEKGQVGDGVVLWDAKTGERLSRLVLDISGWVYDIEFSPDSERIIVGAQTFDEGGGNGQGMAFELTVEELSEIWNREIKRSATSVAYSADGETAIVLKDRERLTYVDQAGRTLMELRTKTSDDAGDPRCDDFAISPHGNLLLFGLVEKGIGKIRYVRSKPAEDKSPDDQTNARPQDEPDETKPVPPYERTITLTAKDQPVSEVMAEIARQAGLTFAIDMSVAGDLEWDGNRLVTLEFDEAPFAEAVADAGDFETMISEGTCWIVVDKQLKITTIEAVSARIAERKQALGLPEWLDEAESGISYYANPNGELDISIGKELKSPANLRSIPSLPNVKKLRIDLAVDVPDDMLSFLRDLEDLEQVELTHSPPPLFRQGRADYVMSLIKDLPKLQELSFNETGVSDEGFHFLKNNRTIRRLSIYQDGNVGDVALEVISAWSQLESFSLTQYVYLEHLPRMSYSAAALSRLSALENLTQLTLIGFNAPGEVIASPKLTSLHIAGASIDDEAAERIASCSDLKSLTLSNTRITDEGMRLIANGTKLQSLYLDGNVAITDEGISHLHVLPLRHVEFIRSRFSDRSLVSLSEVKTLRRLDLYGSTIGEARQADRFNRQGASEPIHGLTIDGMSVLEHLPNLKTLWISGFPSTANYQALAKLKQLRELHFMMALTQVDDLEYLRKELPNTKINATTGGGMVGGFGGSIR